MKKFFNAVISFFDEILNQETEEQKAERESITKECKNLRYGYPVLSDEQLLKLKDRVINQLSLERQRTCCCVFSTPFSHVISVNPFVYASTNGLQSIWENYRDEIENEISRRQID